MANLYFLKGTDDTLDTPLGYCFLNHNVGVTQVTASIVIQIEKPFLYAQKRLNAALVSGAITQAIYDIIVNNQGGTRQLYEIGGDVEIDETLLLELVSYYGISNVDTGGTAAEIVQDIILEGYSIIKKI